MNEKLRADSPQLFFCTGPHRKFIPFGGTRPAHEQETKNLLLPDYRKFQNWKE
jgi:hypothetical protein